MDRASVGEVPDGSVVVAVDKMSMTSTVVESCCVTMDALLVTGRE